VLVHERQPPERMARYAISVFIDIWRAAGHSVAVVYGTDRHVPADVCIVHVDLSVVPAEYLAFARRYPRAVNAEVGDIRKSAFSRLLLERGSAYNGRVIVKTDLNAGGSPERVTSRGPLRRSVHRSYPVRRLRRALGRSLRVEQLYRVYDSLADVPPRYLDHPYVVERFVPEKVDGSYCVRCFSFLGDRFISYRLTSPQPVVKVHTSVSLEDVTPHPDVFRIRDEFRIEYGKLDYVVHGDEMFLLDINKTMGGAGRRRPNAALRAAWRDRASGIDAFLG
jgi:hypothetical protein